MPKEGDAYEVGKLYAWIEVGIRDAYMHPDIVQPYIFFGIRKVVDPGEPYKICGRAADIRGFWRRWRCPFGIYFRIVR